MGEGTFIMTEPIPGGVVYRVYFRGRCRSVWGYLSMAEEALNYYCRKAKGGGDV